MKWKWMIWEFRRILFSITATFFPVLWKVKRVFRSILFHLRKVKRILICTLLVLLSFLLGQLLPMTPLSTALGGLLALIPGLAL